MKILFLLLMIVACQKEQAPTSTASSQVILDQTSQSASSNTEDDFSDLKAKKDESCDDKTADEIANKVEKKAAALQGGTSSDCVVE